MTDLIVHLRVPKAEIVRMCKFNGWQDADEAIEHLILAEIERQSQSQEDAGASIILGERETWIARFEGFRPSKWLERKQYLERKELQDG